MKTSVDSGSSSESFRTPSLSLQREATMINRARQRRLAAQVRASDVREVRRTQHDAQSTSFQIFRASYDVLSAKDDVRLPPTSDFELRAQCEKTIGVRLSSQLGTFGSDEKYSSILPSAEAKPAGLCRHGPDPRCVTNALGCPPCPTP